MKGRLHSIETFGAVDGPGIRTVFFMQGCPARCIYCHNPDSWPEDGGRDVEIDELLHWADRGRPYYGDKGGVTFSGGEPLLQGKFLAEAIKALKEIRIGAAIDTSGTYVDEFTEEAVRAADLILLDIKHPEADAFSSVTGRSQDALFKLIDIINRNGKHVWIRNVVVPGINDSEEDIKKLNDFIKQIRYVDKVELLGYHTMAVNKYGRLNIPYRLKDVPPMDGEKLNMLKALVEIPASEAVSQVIIGK